jgi:hypothetical protein
VSLLNAWWAREAAIPPGALLAVTTAIALTAVWLARTTWRLAFSPTAERGTRVSRTQWLAMAVLGGCVLAGGLAFGPLARRLAGAAPVSLPLPPTLAALLHPASALPATLVAVAASSIARRLGERWRQQEHNAAAAEDRLVRPARALGTAIEVHVLERAVTLVVRAVMSGARATHAAESLLGSLPHRLARATLAGARLTRRAAEQRTLDSLLHRSARGTLALGRAVQRWHTGRLRSNLLWVPITLALVALALVAHGW